MKKILAAFVMASMAVPMAAAPAEAQSSRHYRNDDRDNNRGEYRRRDSNRGDYRWRDNDRNWEPTRSYREGRRDRERRLGRNDRIYKGRDGRAYCRRNDGTTGLVVGGIGGGVLGNLIGGGTLGTLLGAGGGALLGREVDRGNVRCR
ncbi:glycine zipper 2TM domain-containing protein [Sphingomonas xinjiangensis]|uniref:17 kDa surface antigen n=1 Tax=Sphingomonas xinjiangensis TaxID=643568 RepID=A0A840YKK1_9SPHN|nr:glycine zipper 2TM domain-containing protein [Sphingomonas xinjiangensis]MBB5711698.1 Ni/Co efflux regulator RcnB [Sphingomonas xinjiangensis]